MDYKRIFLKGATPTSIGGQAIMEGVMMRGENRTALAVRVPDGRIYLKTEKTLPKKKIMKVPFVRGVYAFFTSLVLGMRTLMQSADILEQFLPEDEIEQPGKVEKALNKRFGERGAWNFMMAFAVAFSVIISIVCFVVFPTIAVNFLGKFIKNSIVLNLIEGVFRILLFVLYVALIRRMEDIKTLFRYHGAEHKTIHCFENGLELTPENAKQFYTLHPRCGTSFLMFVFIISLLLFSLLGWPNVWLRILSRILLLPVIAGVSYELLKCAGRSDTPLIRILSYPGLMMQRLTTAEPTREQLEVAIVALKAVLVDKRTPAVEGFADTDANIIEEGTLSHSIGKAKSRVTEEVAEIRMKEPEAEIMDFRQTGYKRKEKDAGADEEVIDLDKLTQTKLQMPEEVDVDFTHVPTEGDTVVFDPSMIEYPKAVQEPEGLSIGLVEEPEAPAPEKKSEAPKPAADPWPELSHKRYEDDDSMVQNVVRRGRRLLRGKPNGDHEAMDLFCYVMGWSRSEIVTRSRELLDEADKKAYFDRIDLRLSGVPMQYIVKVQEFMGLPFKVNPDVLIPRLDTEILAEQVIGVIRGKGWEKPSILDLCTGSGALGITLAHEFPEASVTLTDVSEAAVRTARENARVNRTTTNCRFLTGTMFEPLAEDETFDVIVSNPPYIPSAVIETLDTEVKDHEPRLALDGGEDGLDAYRAIAMESWKHLRSGGILALEIGHDQAEAVTLLLEISKKFRRPAVIKDLNGLDRVLIAERK